jgi:glycosyltransferase involved in cell wall biosynthesis
MNAGLGGWRSRRGVDVMLRAIELMPKKHPYNFILKTIRPWSEYELGDCPSSLELIEGYLPREEMNSLVGTADLIIYPSRFEGFGISLLEALHRAIPVMCTNGWPMNELQTIVDDRLLIRISEKTPLRLAYSFEPSPQSIVDNLMALSGKNLSKTFPTSEVTKGLYERQKQFITQLREIVQL